MDDFEVPEDRPQLPESLDPDNGALPKEGSAALTLAAKIYRSKGKEGKGETFLLLDYPKSN